MNFENFGEMRLFRTQTAYGRTSYLLGTSVFAAAWQAIAYSKVRRILHMVGQDVDLSV